MSRVTPLALACTDKPEALTCEWELKPGARLRLLHVHATRQQTRAGAVPGRDGGVRLAPWVGRVGGGGAGEPGEVIAGSAAAERFVASRLAVRIEGGQRDVLDRTFCAETRMGVRAERCGADAGQCQGGGMPARGAAE